jgi:hypothetical protein
MISNRLLARSEWEAKLRRWGCEPLFGAGAENTGAEWWQGANKGYPFVIPVEADGSCEFWAIKRICDSFGRPPPPNPFTRRIVH